MGRWRAPTPAASPYITPAGYHRLQEELDDIWLRRRDVVAALADAAAEGDRSENAEYIYRKKELAGLDRRIRYLQKRLPSLNVVRDTPNGERVFFGATVTLQSDEDGQRTFRIVGPDEANAAVGDLSLDSPLAKALLGRRLDDVVSVTTDRRQQSLTITMINYPDSPDE
ncbi:MAG: GreA/GreB family elongation factor [Pseudomonadota bacterium]